MWELVTMFTHWSKVENSSLAGWRFPIAGDWTGILTLTP